MEQLLVSIYHNGNSKPDKQITMPMSVLRLNAKLLPKEVAEALESQGVPVAEITRLEGVEGKIMDIANGDTRTVIAIGTTPKAPPAKKPTVQADTTKAAAAPTPAPKTPPPPPAPVGTKKVARKNGRSKTPHQERLTTETIATEIGWRTGHDLIYAAAAHLVLAEAQSSWSMEEIDEEIRQVNKFYKPFYSTNLAEYLKYLMKNGKFCMENNGNYSLSASSLKYLEERLSEEKMKKRYRQYG